MKRLLHEVADRYMPKSNLPVWTLLMSHVVCRLLFWPGIDHRSEIHTRLFTGCAREFHLQAVNSVLSPYYNIITNMLSFPQFCRYITTTCEQKFTKLHWRRRDPNCVRTCLVWTHGLTRCSATLKLFWSYLFRSRLAHISQSIQKSFWCVESYLIVPSTYEASQEITSLSLQTNKIQVSKLCKLALSLRDFKASDNPFD